MDKKTIILLIAAIFVGILIFVGSIFLLFNGTRPAEPAPTIPAEPLPDFGGDVIIPTEEVKQQITDIDKIGFDTQTTYWIEKLGTVCDVSEELNSGKTLESLCEFYFRDEYKKYKEAMLLGDDELEEYPEDMVNELYNELVTLGVDGLYLEITNRIEDLMAEYKFTMPHNYKIGDLYYDAMLLSEIDSMNSATRVKTIGKVKTPELQVSAAVRQDILEQCAMFAGEESMCFEKGTYINIVSVEEYTIHPESEDRHEKVMNSYFNTNATEMPVVKIRFTIDYEQSPLTIYGYNDYFKLENENHYLYDKDGKFLLDFDDYSDEEFEDLRQWYPDYIFEINVEFARREKEASNNKVEGNETGVDENFSGMASGDTPEFDESDYDTKLFARYQKTVYEAYIPEYSLVKNTYNRIYLIIPVDNLDINCLKTVQAYKDIFKYNDTCFQFIYKNQWSRMSDISGLANEIIGQGTPE